MTTACSNLRIARNLTVFAVVACSTGCYQKMADQPRYKPLTATTFFADGRASRPNEPGTVSRGNLQDDPHYYTGMQADTFWDRIGQKPSTSYFDTFPFEVTDADLKRGEDRFNIYCSVCHGRTGVGDGMVVRRGFTPPPNFLKDDSRGLAYLGEKGVKLKDAPAGYLFSVITRGFGAMATYSAQLPSPRDRWAVVAYIRVLQQTSEKEPK